MSAAYVHTVALMGTVVTVHVVGRPSDDRAGRADAAARVEGWFREVERTCSRFDESSELRRLSSRIGEAVPASDTLYQAVRFALAVAQDTNGAFDPTVGLSMERRGFDRDYRSGATARTPIEALADVSYRDVQIDDARRTITLLRPLLLDLGAVAKGLAIDVAAQELGAFENFAIDAGGDLYLGGRNAADAAWSVGIRHPRTEGDVIETLHVTNVAVCTSGDYERRAPGGERGGHHILDARRGASAASLASVSVVAPSAMVADALGTAAFVLGPDDGLALLERHGVDGVFFTPELRRYATPGMQRFHSLETLC